MTKDLTRLTHLAADILLKIAAAGLVLTTLIVGWQVFGRYVLNQSPSWSEQAALTLMIWYVFLAAAAGVREGIHIRILALENALPKAGQRSVRIVSDVVVAGCGLALAIWGTELVMATWDHIIPSLGLPRGIAYFALPLSGVLIILFSLERLLEEIQGKTVEDEEDPRWS